jgi:hypothetical protein
MGFIRFSLQQQLFPWQSWQIDFCNAEVLRFLCGGDCISKCDLDELRFHRVSEVFHVGLHALQCRDVEIAVGMPVYFRSAVSMPVYFRSAVSMRVYFRSAVSMPVYFRSAVGMPVYFSSAAISVYSFWHVFV